MAGPVVAAAVILPRDLVLEGLDDSKKLTEKKREALFPDGESAVDRDRMHKMLSMDIVKRVGMDRYWLDEKRAKDGNGVLKQRIVIIIIAVILGLAFGILRKHCHHSFKKICRFILFNLFTTFSSFIFQILPTRYYYC